MAANFRRGQSKNRFCVESLEDRVVLSAGLVGTDFPLDGELYSLADPSEMTLFASAQSAQGAAYNLPQTHAEYPYRGSGSTVVVIDSGIDYMHPALGGGYGAGARVIGGWDFVDGRKGNWREGDSTPGPDADPMDHFGHGTMIAGIIGADDDQYPGVAPDVNLISLRVLDADGRGDLNWLRDALKWVIENREEYNIVAVNMSVGVGNYSTTPSQELLASELRTLQKEDVFVTAASGNSFYTYGSRQGLAYPAISPYVVSVGAVYDGAHGSYTWSDGARDYVTDTDRVASFTQRSASLDLMTPGAIVTSTQLSHGGHENYGSYYGTSLASAIASGAAVLAREAAENAGRDDFTDPQTMLEIFQSTGVTVIDGDNESDNVTNTGLSFKRLNLLAAIDYIESQADQTTPDEPTDPQGGGSSGGNTPDNPDVGNPTIPVQNLAKDEFEFNDSFEKATRLGWLDDEFLADLTLHKKDDIDWFMFALNKRGTYKIIVELPAEVSSVDIVFHSVIKGREETIPATIVDGKAILELSLRDRVNYFMEVRSNGEPSMAYNLTISSNTPVVVPDPVPDPPAANTVTPDQMESNDTIVKPSFLGVVGNSTFSNLTLHSNDIDHYMFQAERRTYKVELLLIRGTAKFTFIDVSKNRERTLYSKNTASNASLTVDLRDKVNYFLKVESLDGKPVEYTLRFV